MSRTTALLVVVALLLTATPLAARSDPPSGSAPRPSAEEAEPKQPAPPAIEQVGDRVVVGWRDAGKGAAVTIARGLSVAVERAPAGVPAVSVLATNGRPVAEVVAELAQDPNVAFVEPDYLLSVTEEAPEGEIAAVAVNDPGRGEQYSLDRMRVPDAWSLTKGGSRVVAVLDTGIQANHPDLSGRVVPGYNFVANNTNTADDNGHGTWVAGIIAANSNNGVGIAGISWNDKVMPVKVMGANGTGSTSNVAFGIHWAVDNGAKVINLSIGGFGDAQILRNAVKYAWDKGVVLVGAAGNNRREERFFPASYPEVVSVSATQPDDEFSNWSSYGPDVAVSAPGSSVYTTNCNPCNGWGNYAYLSGTSFATPNAAGVVALIWARYPTYTNAQVVQRLVSTVDDLGYKGWDNRYGHGRINAFRAVGGSAAQPTLSYGDALEANNTLGAARSVTFGTVRPSIYPAGDVDVFAVTAPRAGRIDISVTAITETRPSPWHKSSLPVDPILEVFNAAGTRLALVDDPSNSAATEKASIQMNGAGQLRIRVSNWFPNGNKSAYSLTTAFVDNVAPVISARTPASGATGVIFDAVAVTFSEPVSGVSASSLTLRTGDGVAVPATVGYDSATRRATLRPTVPINGNTTYRVSIASGIKDAAGNALAATSWTFSTQVGIGRLQGPNRYATAAAVSAWQFSPGVPVAYLATGTVFPDALAAGPAAAKGGGPVLLTGRDVLPAETAAELARLKPAKVVVLGSTAVISTAVATKAGTYAGGNVSRLAGSDRYGTAAAISKAHFGTNVPVAYLATGQNFPDALAGGAAAASQGAPILLTTLNSLPSSTAAELARLKPAKLVILGSTAVVSTSVAQQAGAYAGGNVVRLSGSDRFRTAAAISAATYPSNGGGTAFLTTGMNFPDGLAAAAVAGLRGAPLLITAPTMLSPATAGELKRLKPNQVILLGDAKSVSNGVVSQVRAL